MIWRIGKLVTNPINPPYREVCQVSFLSRAVRHARRTGPYRASWCRAPWRVGAPSTPQEFGDIEDIQGYIRLYIIYIGIHRYIYIYIYGHVYLVPASIQLTKGDTTEHYSSILGLIVPYLRLIVP